MKIIIVTQHDPFYLPLFFKNFFKFYIQHQHKIEIKGIVIQQPLGRDSVWNLIKQLYNFYGPIDFSKQALRYIIRQLNYLQYKLGLKNNFLSIPALAKKYNIEVLPYSNVNSQKFIKFIDNNQIELIVSVSATQIFKEKVLTAPKHGCINIHSAPLPRYRGMMPNFWQMYHEEEYSVLTIHRMVKELDKGDIIQQKKTKIKSNMTLDELVCQTKIKAAEALGEVLLKFINNNIEFKPLPDIEGSYFSFPTKEDVENFKAKGMQLL
ncbi:methionyl-tRNA formyltransferase [Sporohalobacter salinus]|uniref:methionyl-tRNA formyltransferase n=1 Tax=Sporohalobacter salinus TaxID=1494606 RepID=UPI001961A11D|nr:formyltransferase family protein [Sporohalobacter salinus]MBM7623179.1 methionyl-tRNA formyltransferase [Sporohalobacter salinus]